MKHRLLSFLACPDCRLDLELSVGREEKGEIEDGTLSCRCCGARFPIVRGIPRFVDMDAYVDTFSFEWNRFHDVQIDRSEATGESEKTCAAQTGWAPGDLRGKLVLDAGVGAGRYAEVVSRWGAEVVGVDLSFAVDAARGNIGARDNVHLVQADLFRLPFRDASFDAAYSLGVLHHTPDTRRAFGAVVPFLRHGGELAVFIYALGHYHVFSDVWRKVTTRMPVRLLYGLTALAIPFYYVYRIPVVGLGLRLLFPMSQHPRARWRWLDTFDWYSPKYQHKHTWPEVHRWFVEQGFEDIRLFQQSPEFSLLHVCMRGRKRPGRESA